MFNRINNRRTRNALAGLVLAGTAVVGATGVVNAASDGSTATDDTDIVGLVAANGEADPADQAERAARREARQEAREEGREEAREEMAALLGLEVEALSEQLQSGSTLADVAAAQGVEVSAVVDLITEQMTERLDAAVADGHLTQEEADEKAAELAEEVQTRVEEGRPERGDHADQGPRGPRGDRGPRAEGGPAGGGAPADGQG